MSLAGKKIKDTIIPARVRWLCDVLERDPERVMGDKYTHDELETALDQVKRLYKVMDLETGEYQVEYTQKSGRGRLFAVGGLGLQGMKSVNRNILSAGVKRDIDISNCHPVLLIHLCEKHNIPCGELKNFVDNREVYYGMLPGDDRKENKKLILTWMNGGEYRLRHSAPSKLTKLVDEFHDIHRSVMRVDPKLTSDISKTKDKWGRLGANVGGRVMNHLICDLEHEVLSLIIRYLESRGIETRVPIFDGLMIDDSLELTPDVMTSLLRDTEAHVHKTMGISIHLEEKPIISPDMPGLEKFIDSESYNPLLRDAQNFVVKMGFRDMVLKPSKNQTTFTYTTPVCPVCQGKCANGKVTISYDHSLLAHPDVCTRSGSRYIGNPSPDTDIRWGPGVSRVVHPPDTVRLNKYDFTDTDMLIVQAPMGTGKTYQLKKLVRQNPGKNFLIVVARVLQGKQLTHELNVGLGKKDKFVFYKDNPYSDQYRRVVTTFESLHKIPHAMKYDFLVMDEARSIFNSMTCTVTNGDKLDTNIQLFLARAHTSKVLMLDADIEIDSAVPDICRRFDTRRIRVERYTCVLDSMRRTARVITGNFMYESIRDDLKNKKKVGVVCRTRKNAEVLCETMKAGGARCGLYTGSTDEQTRMKHWSEPNTYFKDIDLLIFTSTVTGGNDIQLPFDRVYADLCGGGGANAREVLQMLGRFRKVNDPEFLWALPSIPEMKTTYNTQWVDKLPECLDFLQKSREMKGEIWGGRYDVSELGLMWVPNEFRTLKAHNDAEAMQFIPNLFRIARLKSVPIVIDNAPRDDDESIKNLKLESTEKVHKTREENIDASLKTLAANKYSSYLIDELTTRQKKGTLGVEEQVTLDVYHTVKHYIHNRESDKFTVEEYLSFKKNKQYVQRGAAERRCSENPDVCDIPGYAFVYAEWLHAPMGVGKLKELKGKLMDQEEPVQQGKFTRDVFIFVKNMAAFMSIRLPKSTSPDETKQCVAACTWMFRQFGMILKGKQVKIKGVRQRVYTLMPDPEIDTLIERSNFFLDCETRGAKRIKLVC